MCRWLIPTLILTFVSASLPALGSSDPKELREQNRCPLSVDREPAIEGLPNVLILAADTLRADRLGLYGHSRTTTKNLDLLAEDSLVFDRAISPAPWTTPSFAGIFTGRHPGELGIRGEPMPLPSEVPTWAEELSRRGYATAGIVSHIFVGTHYSFDRGFDFWDQRHSGGHATVSSEQVSNLAVECLDTLQQTGRPFFLFAHFFDPHYDYRAHSAFPFFEGYEGELHSGGDNFEELRNMAKAGHLGEEDQAYLFDLYDSEIAFTDSHIGRVLDALKEKGLYDETLIIFLADHGEMFGERNGRWIGHTQFLFDELVHVPLIVKLPKKEGRPPRIARIEQTVSLVDLMPGVLRWLDPTYPTSRSLLPDSSGKIPEFPVFSQTRRWKELDAIYEGSWKLVFDRKTSRPLLYDLSKDPKEQNNVARDNPEKLAHLQEQLDLWDKGVRVEAAKLVGQVAPVLTDGEVEKLRSLGYIR